MGLFNTSTKLSFSEPWFFLIRTRTWSGWAFRIAFALSVGLLSFLAVVYFRNGQLGVWEQVGIALLSALVVLVVIDKGNIQREVTVSDSDIHVRSASSKWWSETIQLKAIDAIELKRPEESPYKCGLMLIDRGDDMYMLAVPHKLSMDTLANVLYRLDLAVALSDWEPPDGDTQVKEDLNLDPDQAIGVVTTESLEGKEPKLLTPVQIGIQLIIGLGPLLLGLVAAIWSGVHLFRHWNELDLLQRCWIGGAGFAALAAGFLYLIIIGLHISSAYAISVSRKNMQRRAEPLFAGTEDDLVAVELHARETWTKPGMAADFGFLQIERTQRMLRFEGSKSRWTIPFGALRSCRIEEGITGGEGNTNGERRYFICLSAGQEEGADDWEFGLLYVRTEIGNDGAEQRYERSKLLFTQLADAI